MWTQDRRLRIDAPYRHGSQQQFEVREGGRNSEMLVHTCQRLDQLLAWLADQGIDLATLVED